MDHDPLTDLSREQLLELVLRLGARVAEVEARLDGPPSTPDDSSMSPAAG